MSTPAQRHDQLVVGLLKAYALCTPLLYIRVEGSAFAFVDLAGPVALALIATRGLRSLEPAYLIYIAYAAVAVASTFSARAEAAGAANAYLAVRLIFISLPFWLAMTLRSLPDALYREIFRMALIGAGAAVFAGVVLHFLGINMQDAQQRLWLGPGAGAAYRAGGLVGNSGVYGQITALFGILLFAAPAIRFRVGMHWQLLGWLMVVLALFLSSSRGGVLMLLAGIAIIGLARPGKALLISLAIGIALAATIAAFTTLAPLELQRYFEVTTSRLDFLNATGEGRFFESVRLQTWAALQRQAFDVPLLGFGYKAFSETFGDYIDNAFLIAWFETGPLGFILFVAFWAVLGLRILVDRLVVRHPASLVTLALFAAFLIRMQTGGANASWSVAPVVFMMLGLGIRFARGWRAGQTERAGMSAPLGAPAA